MKRKLLFTFLILFFSIFSLHVNAQQCRLLTDSVSAGEDMTRHSNYLYDGMGRLIKKEYIDSLEITVTAIDTFYYDGNGDMVKVERYWTGNANPNYTGVLAYNNGKLISFAASGDNGNGPWSMTHYFYYNGNNELTDMVLDTNSITGDPEGMAASFLNMQWNNGNPTYAELVGDLGGGGIDTLELNSTYDNMNNLERLVPISEASDVFGHYSANNLLQVTFINDESMGNAGTVALHNEYTYTAANEVATLREYPGVFDGSDRTTEYSYADCVTSVKEVNKNNTLTIYPNPAKDYLNISTTENLVKVNFYNQLGELVLTTPNSLIELSNIDAGIYFVQAQTINGTIAKKVIVQ